MSELVGCLVLILAAAAILIVLRPRHPQRPRRKGDPGE
jgi:hypothetical protein